MTTAFLMLTFIKLPDKVYIVNINLNSSFLKNNVTVKDLAIIRSTYYQLRFVAKCPISAF